MQPAFLDLSARSAGTTNRNPGQFPGQARGNRVFATLDLGGDVTGNGISKLVFTILSAVAEAERDRIRERVAQVKQDQRDRGRYLGGIVPFGFRVGKDGSLVPDAQEQALISCARALRADGATLRAIQATLEAQYGRKLSLDALHRVLAEQHGE